MVKRHDRRKSRSKGRKGLSDPSPKVIIPFRDADEIPVVGQARDFLPESLRLSIIRMKNE